MREVLERMANGHRDDAHFFLRSGTHSPEIPGEPYSTAREREGRGGIASASLPHSASWLGRRYTDLFQIVVCLQRNSEQQIAPGKQVDRCHEVPPRLRGSAR